MSYTYIARDVQNYDNYDTLNKLFHALSPLGWAYSSWKNDTCPSLEKEERHGNTCRIFVDYKDPDLRKDRKWTELSYSVYDAEGMKTFQYEEFDEVDKLINFLTKRLN